MMRCLLADEQFEQAGEHTGLTDKEDDEEEEDKDRNHYRVNYILHLIDKKSIRLSVYLC